MAITQFQADIVISNVELLTYLEVIDKEIAWCEQNKGDTNTEWRTAFIEGLKQARRLLVSTEKVIQQWQK